MAKLTLPPDLLAVRSRRLLDTYLSQRLYLRGKVEGEAELRAILLGDLKKEDQLRIYEEALQFVLKTISESDARLMLYRVRAD